MDFLLRPWRPEDAEWLSRIANNPLIAANMTDAFPHPYTLAHAEAFIAFASGNNPRNMLCIEIEGRAAGGIGIHPQADIYRMNAELGYWLAAPYWGRGIMPRVVLQMVDYAFQNWELQRIFARPFARNTGSRRVLEKAGFVLEAQFHQTVIKNGVWEDEMVYAMRH